ncbi:MAG: ABC transporter ATP-binding protein [bacterium]
MRQILGIIPFIKPYWKRSLVTLLFLTTMVVMDLSIPRLIQRIIDQGIRQQNQQVVVQTGLIMLGIAALSALIAVINNVLSIQVGESVARDLRSALFLKIQSFSFGDIDRLQTGQLMVRLTSDTRAIQRLTQISLRIGTRAPLLMAGSLVLMINTSPGLALALSPLLLVALVIVLTFIRRMEPLFRQVQEKLDRLNTILQENIAGIRLIKAFVRGDFEGQRFKAANDVYTGDSIRVVRIMTLMSPSLTICVNLGMVVVIWHGGLSAIQGEMTVGQIVAFTNYLLTTMTPLIMMSRLSNVWANGSASAGRVNEILEIRPEVRDHPGAISMASDLPGRIVFENVSFHYNGDVDKPVLRNISLAAEPGQTVAILGATGAGKSTLVNLIPRFYDVSAGRLLVDGMDVRTVRQEALLARIAVVPQESILFSGTIRNNISYGRPEALDEEITAAARIAEAHEFILKLPRGYDTHIEERGVNLSGGQKQRLSIARALLTRPRILILDDCTSAVDVETETRIQEALEEQFPGQTVFQVAQRISTVLRADKIIVIDNGAIAAEGTHQELLQSSSIYREIYDSQLGTGQPPSLPKPERQEEEQR